MPTRIIREPSHVQSLAQMLSARKLPITVEWHQGAPRTASQNRLAFQWYQDIARQIGDQTTEEVRAEAKTLFAAPILCRESEAFRDSWARLRHRMTHEEVLAFVQATELPMTRAMTTRQMTEFLDAMQRHYSAQGVRLTDPEMLKYEVEFA